MNKLVNVFQSLFFVLRKLAQQITGLYMKFAMTAKKIHKQNCVLTCGFISPGLWVHNTLYVVGVIQASKKVCLVAS